mmetsp:Transcript_13119/g.35018  ORF Transcript_13119/g.35018 Transcript_13119/m.35018 type:complete len:239 (-) Transcript_13119:233-949(-)
MQALMHAVGDVADVREESVFHFLRRLPTGKGEEIPDEFVVAQDVQVRARSRPATKAGFEHLGSRAGRFIHVLTRDHTRICGVAQVVLAPPSPRAHVSEGYEGHSTVAIAKVHSILHTLARARASHLPINEEWHVVTALEGALGGLGAGCALRHDVGPLGWNPHPIETGHSEARSRWGKGSEEGVDPRGLRGTAHAVHVRCGAQIHPHLEAIPRIIVVLGRLAALCARANGVCSALGSE